MNDGSSIWQKILRADHHIVDLETACVRFIESKPYLIISERDGESGEIVYRIDRIKAAPTEISLIAGDAIGSLRSALDHFAAWLSGKLGHRPSNNRTPYFPITDTPEQFRDSKLRGIVVGSGQQHILSALDTVKPYKGGNDSLWAIKELNNRDKHRLLLSAMISNPARSEVTTEWEEARNNWAGEKPGETFPFPDHVRRFIDSGNSGVALKDGDVLGRFVDVKPNENPQFVFEVAFDEPGIAANEPIIRSIRNMKVMAARVLTTAAFGVASPPRGLVL